jgi:hypothetical protein
MEVMALMAAALSPPYGFASHGVVDATDTARARLTEALVLTGAQTGRVRTLYDLPREAFGSACVSVAKGKVPKTCWQRCI